MKKLAILSINFYQIFISPFLKSALGIRKFCLNDLSCSEYTKRAIISKGLLKGSFEGALRLAKCNPISARKEAFLT